MKKANFLTVFVRIGLKEKVYTNNVESHYKDGDEDLNACKRDEWRKHDGSSGFKVSYRIYCSVSSIKITIYYSLQFFVAISISSREK